MPPASGYKGLRRTPNREALLAAAEELFGEHGFGAVSVDEIVARAGVAKGTFYNHFSDKDHIAEQTALVIRQDVRDGIAKLKVQSQDPAMHLAIAMTMFLNLAVTRPRRAQVLAALLGDSMDASAQMNSGLRETLKMGLATGRFEMQSIDGAIVLVIGIVSAGIRQLVQVKVSVPQQRIVELVVHALMGLGLSRQEVERVIVPALEEIRLLDRS